MTLLEKEDVKSLSKKLSRLVSNKKTSPFLISAETKVPFNDVIKVQFCKKIKNSDNFNKIKNYVDEI